MKNSRLLAVIGFVGIPLLVGVGAVLWWRGRGLQPTLPTLAPVEITPWVTQPPEEPTYTLEAPAPEVKKLPVYRYEFVAGDARTRAIGWARALGFAGEARESESAWRGKIYTWTEGGKTLVVDENAAALSYSVDLLADPQTLSGSYLPTFAEAAALVERTLVDFGPVSSLLRFDPQKSRALEAGVARVQDTTLAQADLVEVHFIAKIDNYPLYRESGPDDDLVVAWVGKDSRLLRLDYSLLGTVGEKVGDYPLWSEADILARIERGEGTVVETTLEGDQTPASMTVSRIRTGYLLPTPDAKTIQPLFIVSGQVTATDGTIGQTTIYLGAVKKNN